MGGAVADVSTGAGWAGLGPGCVWRGGTTSFSFRGAFPFGPLPLSSRACHLLSNAVCRPNSSIHRQRKAKIPLTVQRRRRRRGPNIRVASVCILISPWSNLDWYLSIAKRRGRGHTNPTWTAKKNPHLKK